MSGPIVRTGTTPKFWENYDKVFGKGKTAGKKPEGKAAKETAKKSPKGKK
ncbi:MAG: hypothetical protein ACK5Q5_24580 [Planctomycetaceae bacterium]